MKELYYSKPYRRLLRTIRLEFGEIKKKFLMRITEGEITRNKGETEFPSIEEIFDDEKQMLKKVWEIKKQLMV